MASFVSSCRLVSMSRHTPRWASSMCQARDRAKRPFANVPSRTEMASGRFEHVHAFTAHDWVVTSYWAPIGGVGLAFVFGDGRVVNQLFPRDRDADIILIYRLSKSVPALEESKMENPTHREPRYRFTGHERVLHDISAAKALPELLSLFGYERVFLVCSRSINTKTTIIEELRASLGSRLVCLTDEVGEHSP